MERKCQSVPNLGLSCLRRLQLGGPRPSTRPAADLQDQMDVKNELTDHEYRVWVTRPTPDAAVIWLKDKATSDRWFCNIPFDSVVDFCGTSQAFDHAPSAVVGLIEDAIRAAARAQEGAEQSRFSYRIERCGAYCLSLKFSFHGDEDVFVWVFPMLPEDPARIQDRDKLRPIPAPVKDTGDMMLDSLHSMMDRAFQPLLEQDAHASTDSWEDE